MGDRSGGVRVTLLAVVFIIATFIVWVATFSSIFYAIDSLLAVVVLPRQAMSLISLCHLIAGVSLVCEVVAYIIWAVASAFQREDQTFLEEAGF